MSLGVQMSLAHLIFLGQPRLDSFSSLRGPPTGFKKGPTKYKAARRPTNPHLPAFGAFSGLRAEPETGYP